VKRGAVVGMAVILSLFLLGPAARAADKPPIKIGVVQPLTGQGANIAKSWLEGMNLAVEMINKEGGILGGRKIEAVVEDD